VDSSKPKPTVLVVEDDHDFRSVLSWTLEEEGFEVIAARDGRDALEVLFGRGELPSLMLLDLWMPKMDGWRLLREIERRMPDLEMPIVVMTAVHSQTAKALNVAEVIEKPFSTAKLVSVVDRHCSNRKDLRVTVRPGSN
jgi:two-component system phosphate regulon response regulator PhoB